MDTIDWTPFFITWELAGKFPAILEDEVVGEQARELFADAQAMLASHRRRKAADCQRHCRVLACGPFGCRRHRVYADESRNEVIATLHQLRQQIEKPNGKPNLSLADFIAPQGSGAQDYIGGFCVTTGHGVEELAAEYEAAHDDYSSIMLKALADRLAEAFAEHLHRLVRTELWGYVTRGAAEQRGAYQRALRGHPTGTGLSRLPGPHRKSHIVQPSGCASHLWC